MKATIRKRQLARYIGKNYACSLKHAKMFNDLAQQALENDTQHISLPDHYVSVAKDHRSEARVYRMMAIHLKHGAIETWS